MNHSPKPWTCAIIAALASISAAAQAPAPPAMTLQNLDNFVFNYTAPGSQLKDYIYLRSRRLFAAGDAARDALQSSEAVRRRQQELRRFFLERIGSLPPSDTPLNARTTGTIKGAGFTVEKIIYESRPHHYVTANLYLPAVRPTPTAAVLFLCGHHDEAKQVAQYQSVCQTLVQAGLIVLAQDPIGQGERLSYYDPQTKKATVSGCVSDHDYAGAQCRFTGDGLARYFLHDAMRGIDYLQTRPEVDAARIGVTGNSGGGTQTCLMMLADPRVAAAAPGTFIFSRDSYQRTGQAQDAEQIWSGFTQAGYDHEDVLLAMAPKPVCVLAVTSDFFPIEGTRRTVERARHIWGLFQRPEALELIEDHSVHNYTPLLAKAAARFFAKHLLGRDVDLASFQPVPWPEAVLQCTTSGQVRGDFADAEFVFDANAARVGEVAAARHQRLPAEQKKRAREWLRTQVFRDREPCEINPRVMKRALKVEDFDVDIAFWWSQPDLANLGMLIRPRQHDGRLPVTIAVWDDGTNAVSRHAAWLREECGKGRAVFVLDLCGMGKLQPDRINRHTHYEFYGTFHKFSDDLDWMGDSLVALRTFETLRALDVLQEWPELTLEGLRIHGHGRLGLYGRLAQALDARIAGGDWQESFAFADFVKTRSYPTANVKSLILPGVLRYFEVDEL